MQLKIEIKVPDDRGYRDHTRPYDIRVTELAVDIEHAFTTALNAMQDIDITEVEVPVKHSGSKTGTLRITLE